MNPIVRSILVFIAALFVGGAVNMGLILLGGALIPPPAGVDVADMESLKANIHLFEARHFIAPWLAHAFGTLVGACLAARLAASQQQKLALGVGFFFLVGGIMNVFMLPAPLWFVVLDLGGAYLPMGWLGGRLGAGRSR